MEITFNNISGISTNNNRVRMESEMKNGLYQMNEPILSAAQYHQMRQFQAYQESLRFNNTQEPSLPNQTTTNKPTFLHSLFNKGAGSTSQNVKS